MDARRWWVWWLPAIGVLALIVLIVVGLVKRQPTIEDCFASLRGLRPVASFRVVTEPPMDIVDDSGVSFFIDNRVYEIREPFARVRPRLLREGAGCKLAPSGPPEWSHEMLRSDNGFYGTTIYLSAGRLRDYDPKLTGLTEYVDRQAVTSVHIEIEFAREPSWWQAWLAKVGIHL